MANRADFTGAGRATLWRLAGWGAVSLLLLLPLVAMRFTDEVAWTASDFAFAAVMLGAVGLGIELAARRSASPAYRLGAALALLAALLTVWVNGAVGMIGSEGNAYNLLFGAVLLIALGGAILARFAPAGMAKAMAAAAIAQALIAALGLTADPLGAAFAMAFALPWLASAWLLRRAAEGAHAPA